MLEYEILNLYSMENLQFANEALGREKIVGAAKVMD
jgi:hypothetical protein